MDTVKLKHLCIGSGQYGLNTSADRYTSDGVRFLRTSDISEGGAVTPSERGVFIPHEFAAGYRLQTGDILLSRSGTVGRSLLYDESTHGTCAFAGYLIRFRPRVDTDPRFLAYFTKSRPFADQVTLASTEATIANVSAEKFARLKVPMHTLRRQRTIADFLDSELSRVDVLVKQKTNLITKLAGKRRIAIRRGVCGTLHSEVAAHDPRIPWAREVRAPWPRVKIKHVAALGTGHTPSRQHPEYWDECPIPWITTGEIQQVRDDRAEVVTETREKISEIGLANSAAALHPKGTVVLCRTASAGYSAIMGADMATSQDFVTWTCSEALLPRYLLMCLRAMRNDLLGRLAYGSTHKTIYFPDIESLVIPLPPVEEQREVLEQIDALIGPIDDLVDRLRRQIELISEHRQALITAAVTGQLDVAKVG